jgi:hypothetical protein
MALGDREGKGSSAASACCAHTDASDTGATLVSEGQMTSCPRLRRDAAATAARRLNISHAKLASNPKSKDMR